MTTITGSADDVAMRPSSPRSSVAADRARRLLVGGLAGAHVAALTCVGIFLVRDGLPGLAAAGLGAGLVMLFYTVGQWVQVLVADAPAQNVFRASVGSYLVRVAALGAVLYAYLGWSGGEARLLAAPLAITAIATVVGWLTGEVLVFARLRIPNFDEPGEGASGHDA